MMFLSTMFHRLYDQTQDRIPTISHSVLYVEDSIFKNLSTYLPTARARPYKTVFWS